MARQRVFLQQLGEELPRGRLVAERAVALRQPVQELVLGNALRAAHREILRLRVGVVAAVELAVGHRHPVGGQHRERGQDERGDRHFVSSLAVASEKFHTPAPRQTSMTFTSES